MERPSRRTLTQTGSATTNSTRTAPVPEASVSGTSGCGMPGWDAACGTFVSGADAALAAVAAGCWVWTGGGGVWAADCGGVARRVSAGGGICGRTAAS